jgi:hypothetical protein
LSTHGIATTQCANIVGFIILQMYVTPALHRKVWLQQGTWIATHGLGSTRNYLSKRTVSVAMHLTDCINRFRDEVQMCITITNYKRIVCLDLSISGI